MKSTTTTCLCMRAHAVREGKGRIAGALSRCAATHPSPFLKRMPLRVSRRTRRITPQRGGACFRTDGHAGQPSVLVGGWGCVSHCEPRPPNPPSLKIQGMALVGVEATRDSARERSPDPPGHGSNQRAAPAPVPAPAHLPARTTSSTCKHPTRTPAPGARSASRDPCPPHTQGSSDRLLNPSASAANLAAQRLPYGRAAVSRPGENLGR